MRSIHLIAAVAILMAAGTAQAARVSPEAKLAKIVDGRVAGPPVDCIQLRDIQSSEIIDRSAIVYHVSGKLLYVNTVSSGAAFLDDDDILVSDTHSSQLCSIDTLKLVDRSSHMSSGSVGLGKFVPYRKVGK